MKAMKWILAAAVAGAGGALHAHHGEPADHASMKVAQASADMAQGEVRKVDRGSGKLTLKHGEIRNLDMPPMTMVFRVRDPKMLDAVKTGDKVRFTAEKIDGAYTVIAIEPAQ